MRVTVTRSGGFAGLTQTWTITVDEQPDSADWAELIDRLPWGRRPRSAPQPDRYVYDIRCARHRVTLPEQQLTGPWRELVDRVRERSAGMRG
ncbi:MAG TPA: protealysin inhibitor emfourin [Glaciihabitans sp.]|jgi:hypothetical protein|nr:protealysin inhibitor emfourin [Glaciihabitans sp.]